MTADSKRSAFADVRRRIGRWLAALGGQRRPGDGPSASRGEHYYLLAQRMAKIGHWLWRHDETGRDPEGTWEYSTGAAEIFGVEPKELAVSDEQFLARFVHPDDRALVADAFARRAERRRPGAGLEFRIVRPDGTVRSVAVVTQIVDGDPAAPREVMGTIQDVTAQRALDESLRQREGELLRAQRLARIGHWLWTTGKDGAGEGTVSVSDVIAEILGLTPADLPMSDTDYIARFVHPDDRARVRDAYDTFYAKLEAPPPLEYRIVRADGAVRTILEISETVEVSAHGPVKVLGTLQDVTEWRQVEDRVRQSEQRLARAQTIAKIGHWVWSGPPYAGWTAGKVEFSAAAAALFGVEPAELAVPDADYLARFVHPEDRERVRAAFADYKERRKKGTPLEYRIVRPDGGVRTIVEITEAVAGDPDHPTEVIGTIHDITEQVRAEAALRASEAQLRRAQQMARLGHWTWYPAPAGEPGGDRSVYSEEAAAILGVAPADLAAPTRQYMDRFVHPDEFAHWRAFALQQGLVHVESGPLVRSSYHAELQAGAFHGARTADGAVSHPTPQLQAVR